MAVRDDRREYVSEFPPDQLAAVRAHYAIPLADDVEPAGGTASPKVILGRRPGRYLLKRRRQEFSAPSVVDFDHAVIAHLADAGLPVVPMARTADGATAVHHGDWAFELNRYVEDLTFYDQTDDEQLAEAGELLGRLHVATTDYEPPGGKPWTREFHIGTNRVTLERALGSLSPVSGPERELAERMLAEAQRTEAELPDDAVAALPTVIVHGDFTWANLMYRDGHLAGLFDFDWTYRQTSLDDLARAMLFLAFTRREPLRADTIWDLQTPWQGDLRRARLFLAAYERHRKLSPDQRRLLAWFMRETTLSGRIRAMRKVPDDDKLRMLTFGMEPILDWWDALDELETSGK